MKHDDLGGRRANEANPVDLEKKPADQRPEKLDYGVSHGFDQEPSYGANMRDKTVVTVISEIRDRFTGKNACLVVIYGPDLGRKYDLDKPTVIIGRSSKTDIQVDQESISRNHCKLINTGKNIIIRDLGSTNGTYVNDQLVDETILKDGDLVKIGRTIFKFLSTSNIENAYHEEIYRLTTRDGLTQVYNKRYLMETLENEISRCHRYNRDLSIIMFDIDHFKRINDHYGHLAGDYVLKEMAHVIKNRIRKEDILARYGGEEFTIILPEIDNYHALIFAEKVRRIVEETEFYFESNRIPITISIGVANINESIVDTKEFIRIADENLYRAKRAGRNCVRG